MKIKSFELGGQKFKIKHIRKMNEIRGCWGFCDFDKGLIEICHPDDCSEDIYRVTLLHEIFHSVLFAMSQNDLSKNEAFVVLTAQLVAQIIKSAK